MSSSGRRPAPQPSSRTNPAPSFSWLEPTRAPDGGHARRIQVAREELAARASMFHRLGFSEAEATQRLAARVAWEFSPSSRAASHGAHSRPEGLSDAEIAKLVAETYARRPG
jgi:hypothetical protein